MEEKKSLFTILRAKYSATEYALLQEVRDASGFNASRSADFLIFSLWPSRGHAITGIEVKSFRSDWLREIRNPQKAEAIFQYCDYFYLLIEDENVAKLAEIPETWGLMCVKGSRIKILKEAPKLTPVGLSKSFVGAMLKRACIKDSKLIHEDEIEERIKERVASSRRYEEQQIEKLEKEKRELKSTINEFEKASGLELNSWRFKNTKALGEAVKFVMDGGLKGLIQDFTYLKSSSEKITGKISEVLKVAEEQKKDEEKISKPQNGPI